MRDDNPAETNTLIAKMLLRKDKLKHIDYASKAQQIRDKMMRRKGYKKKKK